MTGFRGIDKLKKFLSTRQIREEKTAAEDQETANAVSEESNAERWTHRLAGGLQKHKWTLAKSVLTIAFIGGSVWSGHQYVQGQMVDYYNVYANGTLIGSVTDKQVIEQFSASKKEQLKDGPDNVTMVVQEPSIAFNGERAFKVKPNNEQVMAQLDGYFSAYPTGVEMFVDGKSVGIVKDEATAQAVLKQIKDNALASMQPLKQPGKVAVLSAAESAQPISELQSAEFVQQVELKTVKTDPSAVINSDELLAKLETGDVQPTKYTVEEGDCVSCIAQKFDIPKQVIYENNTWIENDMIKVGEQLDLTVLQPTLAVRTVEKVIENQEIQYETTYQTDDTLRLGTIQVLSPGKNGMKKVTIELTKVNGMLESEAVLSEEITQQPVTEISKKGTKVIKGEGTGKFAWPVISSSISSTYGKRWGTLHKGIDLTGNKNILASDNGKVIFAGVKDGYGNTIIVDHLNGYTTLYGHMSKLLVKKGDIVEKGDKIGVMGSTGQSTGVHLHFEIMKNGTHQNPLKFLNR